jgi:hypothetical protein
MAAWTILTCEYPPACGGVGDYTATIAGALAAAGDRVIVCTPPKAGQVVAQPGVEVVVLPDVYGPRARKDIDQRLDEARSIVLLQYVPTAFGLGGANVPACRWLLQRSRGNGDDVRVMFHEPYFEFAWTPAHQTPLSIVQRSMARTLLRASRSSRCRSRPRFRAASDGRTRRRSGARTSLPDAITSSAISARTERTLRRCCMPL